jgi:hypothetical protein
MKIVYMLMWVPLSFLFGPAPWSVIGMLLITALFMTLYEGQVKVAEAAARNHVLSLYMQDVKEGRADVAVRSSMFFRNRKA